MINFKQNNNYNNSSVPSFGNNYTVTQQTPQQVQIPAMYNPDNDSFVKEAEGSSLKDSPLGMLFGPWIEHPLITFGTWLGVGAGIDAFANACCGEYDKSIVGKAANLGDKIHNSKFFQSEPMKKIGNFFGKGKAKTENVLNKSQLFRAAKDMSIKPENTAGKGLLYTTKDEIVMEFVNHIAEEKEGLGLTNPDKAIKLKHLYLTKEEQEFIKNNYGKTFNSLKGAEEAKVANHIVLKRLNLDSGEISKILSSSDANVKTKEEVLKLMSKGLKDPLTIETLKDMSNNPRKYHEVVEQIAENTKGKVWCSAGGNKLGPIGKLFRRRISMDGIYNKSKSIGQGAKTSTGRFFSKAIQTVYRGLTFGGGKLGALLFIAPGFVEMVKNTIKADKDKKVGTAAWGFISSWSWVISFMLGGKLLYGAASMKNAGISKDIVEECNNRIDKFNEDNEKKLFTTRKAYRKAKRKVKDQINELRKVENQSLFNKIVAKLSGILSYDLKKFNGRRTDSVITTALNKFWVGVKGKSGLVLKFALFMFAIMPFIDGILHKASNLLFGKDYDPYAEDEKADAKKEQDKFTKEDLKERLIAAQEKKLNNANEQSNTLDNVDNNSSMANQVNSALAASPVVAKFADDATQINSAKNISVDNSANSNTNNNNAMQYMTSQEQNKTQFVQADNKVNSSNPYSEISRANTNQNTVAQTTKDNKGLKTVDNYTYIPSSECKVPSATQEYKKNQYIPSQVGAKITKTFDNSGLSSALSRADRAEQRALEVLAGKFTN